MGRDPSCAPRLRASLLALGLGWSLSVSGAVASTSKAALTIEVKSVTTHVSEAEFRAIALELAPRVNLFRDVWAIDPNAKFTSGVVRDYLYWIRARVLKPNGLADLRNTPSINIREILLENSDIDLLSLVPMHTLEADRYGFKRIEHVAPDRFTPGNAWHQSELHQGFVPIEKLVLGQTELGAAPGFGDGVKEIFDGKPTVVIPTDAEFSQTHFAKLNANHLILLTFRYFRALSLNHERTGKRNIEAEISALPVATRVRIGEIVNEAMSSDVLLQRFKNQKFAEWFYNGIEKAYRGGNPTFTEALIQNFGLHPLIHRWANYAPPINQYLFEKPRTKADLAIYADRMAKAGVDPKDILIDPASLGLEKGLFHGTKDDQSFSDILLRGVLQSRNGVLGKGLYVVTEDEKDLARMYAELGGDEKRIVRFEGDAGMRIVSVSNPALVVLKKYYLNRLAPGADADKDETFDHFLDAFGIDAVQYNFDPTRKAIVVKNSRVLSRPVGVYRTVMTYDRALEFAPTVQSEDALWDFFMSLSYTSLTPEERWKILKDVREPRFMKWVDLIQAEPNLSPTERGHLAELGLSMLTVLNGPNDLLSRVLAPWNSKDPADLAKDRFYTTLGALMKSPKVTKVFSRLGENFEWTTLSEAEAKQRLKELKQRSFPLDTLIERKWNTNIFFRLIYMVTIMNSAIQSSFMLMYGMLTPAYSQSYVSLFFVMASNVALIKTLFAPSGRIGLMNDFVKAFDWTLTRYRLKRSLRKIFVKALDDAINAGPCNAALTPLPVPPIVEKTAPEEDAA